MNATTETVEITKEEKAKAAIKYLKQFIPKQELKAIQSFIKGEEAEYFIDKVIAIQSLIQNMPKTGEQDGKGDEAIIYLHYFKGGCDWYITEKDMGGYGDVKGNNEEPLQEQAFGLANIGYGAEYGYISIIELLENNVELDLHFTPKPLKWFKDNGKIVMM